MRKLGIPTVVDRFIQQAVLQALYRCSTRTFKAQPRLPAWTPSARRHRRSAKVHPGRAQVGGGRGIPQFFDRVNHDVLMGRLVKRIGDRRRAGADPPLPRGRHHGQRGGNRAVRRNATRRTVVAAFGQRAARRSGQEAGETRSRILRYADDCNVYVRSRRAGERVMGLLRRLYAGLRLRINEAKSAVDLAWKRKILGYYSGWPGIRR